MSTPGPTKGNPKRVFLDRELIGRRADAFVAVSREDQRRMVEVERVPAAKTRFIANGIPAFPPPDPSRDVRAELGLGARQPLIGVVATLRPQKALDVLLKAVPMVRERIPEAAVLIVGGGDDQGEPEEERLHAVARELRTRLRGEIPRRTRRRPRPGRRLRCRRAQLRLRGQPALGDGVHGGRQAGGGDAGGGLPDLVEDEVSGLLVDPQDPAALAGALVEVLHDPDAGGANGRGGTPPTPRRVLDRGHCPPRRRALRGAPRGEGRRLGV